MKTIRESEFVGGWEPRKTIRESEFVGGACWALGIWALIFAFSLAVLGDNVTSKQWNYLFTIPGHYWTWSAMFGLSGLSLLVGCLMKRPHYKWRAIGLLGIGTSCLMIAAFYGAAPLVDPGLVTFGSFAWLLGVGSAYYLAVVNWKPIPWF